MLRKYREILLLLLCMVAALALFLLLYHDSQISMEVPETTPQPSPLSSWTLEDSAANGVPFRENKNIYTTNNQIHDVYITVFPTEDETGKLLDFSCFELHQSRDHSYNPILNCNVQILEEGETPSFLLPVDTPNATIRVRGNSSRGDTYKSYKVKLRNEKDSFYGLNTLNINKHSEDVTKIATKLGTDLLVQIPDLASFRSYFMRVWIRDASLPKDQQSFQYYGLYTDIEQPNKSYLESRGLPSEASLYKARNFSFRLDEVLKDVDDPGYDETQFESVLGIREGKDHQKLLQMLEAVNDETNDFQQVFDTYFNEDNYLTFLAFSLLTGNNDIINHNFLLYNPNNSQTWYFIPWDFDGTLHFGEYESSLMKLPESLRGIQKLNQSILHKRYLRLDHSQEKIQAKMQELLKLYMTEDKMDALVQSYLPVLEKTVILEPDLGLMEMPPDELPDYLYSLRSGFLQNYQDFLKASEYPVPMYVAYPEIRSNGTVHFAWQPSFSYQGRTITYTVRVYEDYGRNDLIFEKENILGTTLDADLTLPRGTYYLDVLAIDSDGNEQISMEHYETMLTSVKAMIVNGLLQFTVE